MILFFSAQLVRAEGPRPLTTVAEVRALTPEQAEGHHPVRLTGVVTYYDGLAGHAFLQDETGGIFIRPGKQGAPDSSTLEPGDRIEVSGITWAGNFSPSVAGSGSAPASSPDVSPSVAVRHLGKAPLPEPAQVSFDQLTTGRWHDQFVSVRATIRDFKLGDGDGPRSLALLVSGPDGKAVNVWAPHVDPGDRHDWIDQEIELHAIVAGGGDSSGQLSQARLLISNLSWIIADDESTRRAFSQSPTLFDGIHRYQPPAVRDLRLRVDGTVSLVKPGEGFFLTDGSRGLWVGTPQKTDFRVGDVVTTAGYAVKTGLADGLVRTLARGPSPAARLARMQQLINSSDSENSLVSVEGLLKDVTDDGTDARLRIEDLIGNSLVATTADLSDIPTPGSRLLLTGILHAPGLLLRDAQDIVVLDQAPWLSPGRRKALVAGSIVALALATVWLVSLKLQVASQTRLIEAQIIHQTLVGERQRLGRELHDSLEQHLVGLHLQLDTLRDRIADAPESVRQLADNAAKMLDHCRDEARRSVHELRSQILQREGLAAALVQMAADASHPDGPKIVTETNADSVHLESTVEFHLLRCAQEAVTNALKHAGATNIRITLEHLPEQSILTIQDDGGGFDPETPPRDKQPHFGLLHLRERAARINARLTIMSQPGGGTRVTLTIPQP
ncbi:MAG: histidine kinase [Luteolibacter sp.]|uniref:histidine kinase n=1 Tax=Luteolibacter sp. TaxID=1962973 RepID=UPI003264CF53